MKSDKQILSDYLGIRWHENGTVSHYPSVLPMRMGEDYLGDLKFDTSWDYLIPVLSKLYLDHNLVIFADYDIKRTFNQAMRSVKSLNPNLL